MIVSLSLIHFAACATLTLSSSIGGPSLFVINSGLLNAHLNQWCGMMNLRKWMSTRHYTVRTPRRHFVYSKGPVVCHFQNVLHSFFVVLAINITSIININLLFTFTVSWRVCLFVPSFFPRLIFWASHAHQQHALLLSWLIQVWLI